ncbi:exonuclease domain-containing protein [Dehalococcoidia bacterium]|nr:exonuclease domain-containing protein [Dehalococcoidia bacterium]MCL0104057.1 exonuclease domain-containing protein [Dehalococcoidia bacterium]
MMDQTYVALDLETTGLSPESDEIIEIGAVKFRDGREIDVFQSLVNPHRRIPYLVKSLCAISQEEVDAAPPFSALAEGLIAFLEGCPVVGHNVSFDLGFLAQKGISLPNPAYDTLAMSRLLLPHLSQRNLIAVASHLGIPHPSAHRALNDAMAVKEIFTVLLSRLCELPPSLLGELVRLTAKSDWWLGGFLEEVLQERAANFLLSEADFEKVCFGHRALQPSQPLTPSTQRVPLDVEELAGFFAGDGPLARTFPQTVPYEQRPEQVKMMRAVAEALNGGRHLIVEAGTGTGKSMAYLLPAAFYAYRNNIPVVISTNTINLQEQLVHKDIPDLVQAIGCQPVDSRQSAARSGGLSTIDCLKVVQVKGRTNYLCLRRWDSLRKADGLALEVSQLLARIQVWLPATQTGDRSEINLDDKEQVLWSRVCAQGYDCLGRRCPYHQRGICFLHSARNAATGAHLIVTNHALLLSEMAAGTEILPEYSHLIIDEAHHLESVATDQLGTELRERDLFDHLDQIIHETQGQRFGFLPQLEHFVRTTDMAPSRKDDLEQLNQSLNLGVARVHSCISEFFNGVSDLIQRYTESRGEYDLHLRLTSAIRSQPAWSDIEINCENLLLSLENIARILGKIHPAIDDLAIPETLKLETLSLVNANEELRHQISSLVFHPRDNTIHWLTLGRKSNMICLHSAPLHVGLLLQNSLYSDKDSLILTGATLSTEGNFRYLKERLSLEDTEELLLGSPFDYGRAALIYLVTDIPEPGREGYQSALARALVSLCRATGGRCLVLFTSHAALRATHAAIRAPLEEEDILVLGQGVDGSPQQLLSAFRSNPRTVILGAASFWEGVDVVGETLSVLVIVRLPFSVPTDPIFAARSETFDDPFNEYSLPQTAFRFKQGFGRLIRSKTDRGVMVVLDSRLSTRNYGSVFVNSLPQCRLERGPSRNLPKAVQDWLGGND